MRFCQAELHLVCAYMHTVVMKWDGAAQHLDGIVAFLAVARLGRLTAAAESIGVNHSTISRRIAALETSLGGRLLVRTQGGWEVTEQGRQALGAAERIEEALAELAADSSSGRLTGMVRVSAPEAFASWLATPALAQLQNDHPDVSVELVSATQRARQYRTGLDLEVVVGRPHVHRAEASWLRDYSLNLYATRSYLQRSGTPRSLVDLGEHRLNYYVESMLAIDDLDRATERLPPMPRGIASTSVHSHLAATLTGSGIGLLPDFAVADEPRLMRVLPDEFSWRLSYWAVGRQEAVRNPLVQQAYVALRGDRSTTG